MPGRKRYSGKNAGRKLHLGEWLKRLDISQAVLAEAVDVTPTYISELINPKPGKPPKSPAPHLLLAISEFLGITVNDLYWPPPTREQMERAKQITPAQQALLARLLSGK